MKYTLGQKIWMAGVVVYAAWIMGDVLNFIDIPPIYMLAGIAPFLLTWGVMPSMAELNRANRRSPAVERNR